MASNGGGPWGGGDDDDDRPGGGRRGERPRPNWAQGGSDRLKVLMGGGGSGGGAGGPGGLPEFPGKLAVAIGLLVAFLLWAFASFYTVKPEEKSVELFLGEFSGIGTEGLNFAPWPFVRAEVLPVTREQIEDIGVAAAGQETGLMLTTDENIVDIDFQVVWNISDPAKYLFNLADPQGTIRAVSESAMREIVAASELAPILNRDRARIQEESKLLIQSTLDAYDSGVFIVRVNLNKVDPPLEVIDAFRDVQAAEQERDRLQREADAYANKVLAGARGQSATLLEAAEAYRARVVNEAEGEASRFVSVLNEYRNAPEVTRKRLYLETIEGVLGQVDKIILDDNAGGDQGVVPYLPLDQLRRSTTTTTEGN